MARRLCCLLALTALLARGQDWQQIVDEQNVFVETPAADPIGFALPATGKQFPILQLQGAGQPLPVPPTVRDAVQLTLVPNEIRVRYLYACSKSGEICRLARLSPCLLQGPGDNTSNPYVLFTARVYNDTLTPVVARVQQGASASRLLLAAFGRVQALCCTLLQEARSGCASATSWMPASTACWGLTTTGAF